MALQRRREIIALVKLRHGRLPITDDAVIYVEALGRHLEGVKDRPFALASWCIQAGRAPTSDELKSGLAVRLYVPRAGTIGKVLRLTAAERGALGITTIRAIDLTEVDRKTRKQARDRERQRLKRLADGRVQRAAYRANSRSAQRPWEAEGVSRATFYRKLAGVRQVRRKP